ncbi:hypothetical protein GCM10008955_09670 [Deinococcus malanensis]|uniref:Uncharacterized protein n=1 Tax=Deinococcus malanensis TaxID=1706855 RepID=A0ABQ2ESE7_9DEIO|nr:metal ABC transporter permease [Deinococcus malanensis]GGK18321.1 hypothetical protein GCM10008955_09670 [Deinococcus malanensis]
MIIPPACAFLLTQRLAVMLGLSMGIGVLASAAGYGLSVWLNSSIAGMIATVLGVTFVGCVLFSPLQGLVATLRRRSRQRQEFSARLLLTALHGQMLAPTAAELASRLE